MNGFLLTIQEGLRRVRKGWIITAVVALGLILGVAGFASGTFTKAIAAIRGDNAIGSVNNQVVETPIDNPPLAGLVTPTAMPAMPGMVLETPAPSIVQPSDGDLDALSLQMLETMKSLEMVVGQLEQKSAIVNIQPTAAPAVTIDVQAVMAEMQAINQEMGPLMLRIQADLQGNPSAEELASVRSQVIQINTRIGNLVNQIQAARGYAMPGTTTVPTMQAMPGMSQYSSASNMPDQFTPMMARFDAMMAQMQDVLHQMQTGSIASLPGTMPGMTMATPTHNSGTSSATPSMDKMMVMMDDIMSIMDEMMGMSGMNMSVPTTMPSMSNSGPSMGMMDDMMMMMDEMMAMMDAMMGMPDM